MRNYCRTCVMKHLAQAVILMSEVRKGYPQHRWLAIGHLAEAEDECESENLVTEIRRMRKTLEAGDDVPLDLEWWADELELSVYVAGDEETGDEETGDEETGLDVAGIADAQSAQISPQIKKTIADILDMGGRFEHGHLRVGEWTAVPTDDYLSVAKDGATRILTHERGLALLRGDWWAVILDSVSMIPLRSYRYADNEIIFSVGRNTLRTWYREGVYYVGEQEAKTIEHACNAAVIKLMILCIWDVCDQHHVTYGRESTQTASLRTPTTQGKVTVYASATMDLVFTDYTAFAVPVGTGLKLLDQILCSPAEWYVYVRDKLDAEEDGKFLKDGADRIEPIEAPYIKANGEAMTLEEWLERRK